jgi:hypothetical protein
MAGPAWLMAPQAQYREPVRAWLVLDQPPSPTTDYYVRPRAAQAGVPVAYRAIQDDPSPGDLKPGTLVIIVRYVRPKWVKALREHQAHLAGVVYLLDDDLFDPQAWRDLPLGYRWRLWRHQQALRPLWRRLVSTYWVSTPALAQRYPQLGAQVMPPLPASDEVESVPSWPAAAPSPGRTVLLFYHGTRSHQAEMAWLQPIVAQALAACPHLHFEVMGNGPIQQLFRDLPRTRVLHPMSWSAYLAHCRWLADQHPGQRIGLAPLLPSAFNAVRSHTRVWDIARCAAVGLYADEGPYAQVIRHGQEGWLLPPVASVWCEAIVSLYHDAEQRQRMSQASVQLAQRWGRCDRSATFAPASPPPRTPPTA